MECLKIVGIFTLLICVHTDKVIISSNKFSEVMKSKAFVDKTLLVKEVLNHECMLITAPRRFMKSTNLDMMKSFLSITVTEDGQPQKIRISENVHIFQNLNIFKKERNFFDNNYGKFPVLYLDLKADEPVTTYGEVVENLMEKIHNTFLQHRYLCNSSRLIESEKELCSTWCDDYRYESLNTRQFKNGLVNLARYMYNHFNHTKIYVLVDEYDAIITKAMLRLNRTVITNIVELVVGQVSKLLKSNGYVNGGVVTGTSQIAGSTFSELNNLNFFKFLHQHSLVEYYGFTEDEVERLLKKPDFNLSIAELNKAYSWYDPYTCMADRRMYNPYSILNFLKFGRVERYWQQPGYIDKLEVALTHPSFKSVVDDLLKNKNVSIEIQQYFELQDLLNLRDMFIEPTKITVPDNSLLLTHLLDLGYLSFVVQNITSGTRVRIPNDETWYYVFQKMKKFFMNEYNAKPSWLKVINRYNYKNWTKVL